MNCILTILASLFQTSQNPCLRQNQKCSIRITRQKLIDDLVPNFKAMFLFPALKD